MKNFKGYQTLVGEYLVVNREFTDLQCLMNTLSLWRDPSPSPLLLDHTSLFYIMKDWGGVQRLNEAQWTSWNAVSIGFIKSLEFSKQSWNLSSSFQDLEIKCGKMVKSLEFFRQYFCCSASWRKALSLYWSPIRYSVTLSPEKEIIVVEKSLEKVLNFESENLYEPGINANKAGATALIT